MPSHKEKRALRWSADQMYALVADVARYPEFLPWTSAARIRSRRAGEGGSEVLEADLVISFKVFRERFGSRVVLYPAERRIETDYLDGPFRHMHSHWQFLPAPEGPGCVVDFAVDFEFRNAILQAIIGVVFDEAMRRVVRAFEARAEALYGKV
ncbi:MAG: type II toxin-antitoxin system RatA family toxin [Proteobacteria bacterium]|nr:type II toxin-antitoxin system RatA family toxin [Pseudomonadota bacterium]MBS0573625.1 type II toxin-antitoxin system RatA family toxin [Pseudomonadota bacterium]